MTESAELEALSNLLDQPPLDDVLLEKAVAVRSAKAIRVVLERLSKVERGLRVAVDEMDLIRIRLLDDQPEHALGAAVCGLKEARAAIYKARGEV